ncbi:MAG: diadenylate cyclase CdaA [Acidobacteriota bacterium]
MIESFFSTVGRITIRDISDILVIAFLVYQGLRLIRGTRAWQMTLGVIALILLYLVSRTLELRSVKWVLENSFPYFVFALIVVYQSEIRRALVEIGRGKFFRRWNRPDRQDQFEEIVLAATSLAGKKIGGLIVLEGEIGLKNYVDSGIKLDAFLTYDLLLTIFNPRGPLHDGAVIIQENRISAAACFLPLTLDPYLSKELGTRHRAAIGLTEETDAVAVVVSEETGKISGVYAGEIVRNLDGPRLMKFLQRSVEPERKLQPSLESPSSETERRREAV